MVKDPAAITRLIEEIDRYLARFEGLGTPELYVPLTGPHEWRFGIGESWTEYKAVIEAGL